MTYRDHRIAKLEAENAELKEQLASGCAKFQCSNCAKAQRKRLGIERVQRALGTSSFWLGVSTVLLIIAIGLQLLSCAINQ